MKVTVSLIMAIGLLALTLNGQKVITNPDNINIGSDGSIFVVSAPI